MHELSLMEAVRDQSLAAANAEGATRITAISLRIGSLAGVEPEASAWERRKPPRLVATNSPGRN